MLMPIGSLMKVETTRELGWRVGMPNCCRESDAFKNAVLASLAAVRRHKLDGTVDWVVMLEIEKKMIVSRALRRLVEYGSL